MVTVTPVDENEKDVFLMDSILGPTLLKDVKGPPVPTADDALKSNKSGIVALYFSASWCPPCQRFTPILIDFYNTAKAANCGFEVVFVSSDRSVEEFDTYFGKMPWLAIPTVTGSAAIKGNLATTLGVRGIPALAILDAKTGEIISGGEARDDVMQAGGDKDKIAATVAKWQTLPRQPLSNGPQLMEAGEMGKQNIVFKFLSFLAKNPMVIFGLIYFYKWMQRKMIEMGFDDDNSGGTKPVGADSVEDSEF